MKINWFNFGKIKEIFSQEALKALKFLPKVLSRFDKILLGFLIVVIITAILFLIRNHWLKTTVEVPAYGGTFIEGVVGEAKDFDKHLARLTGAGLTRLTKDGEIQGDLAESWEMLDDDKTYQFKLREGFNAQDLAYQISSRNIWSNIEIATPADNLITFRFKQSFSPFLYIATEPVFHYGPYKVVKEEKNRLTLMADEIYWQGQPHIEKIIINLYPNQQALSQAGRSHEIMGYINSNQNGTNSNSQLLTMALPRELNLFFNLSKADLKNKTLRQALRDGKPADKDYNFTLVTSDAPKNVQIAENLKEQWLTLKINLEIKKYDNVTLQKDIIPKRDYDLLLYSIDYGPDPDPYPFWHTSQIASKDNIEGMNLSNYSNKNADQLLEQARQSFDPAVRNQKYEAFKKILDDEAPYILINKEKLNYVLSNKVKGVDKIFGSSETDRFLDINQWYIKSKRVKK